MISIDISFGLELGQDFVVTVPRVEIEEVLGAKVVIFAVFLVEIGIVHFLDVIKSECLGDDRLRLNLFLNFLGDKVDHRGCLVLQKVVVYIYLLSFAFVDPA